MTNTDTNTQAVVDETNAAPQAAAEVTNAREGDELESVLKEFETQTKPVDPPKPATQPGADSDIKVLTETVKGLLNDTANRQYRADMETTLKSVRGDLPADVFDDSLVEAWIDGEARKDPRLAQAWQNRAANPKQFQKVVEGLGRNFAKKFSKLPDKNATEDREVVTAAVRGASNQAPEGKAPDVKGMTDAELRDYTRKNFGFSAV